MTDNLDEVRTIEGFPLGADEDLHALSNPPFYTAYPNPHIQEFISQKGRVYDESSDDYKREPFTSDVSSPKNSNFYTVHSYHTKVPDLIIQQYIKYYTDPGDLVIDVFAGSGMTGVAAQALGRSSILIDLCPMATHISNNYIRLSHRVPTDAPAVFEKILSDVEREFSWMYKNENGEMINWCVWSEVLECPYCNTPNVFHETATSNNTIRCLKCSADLPKKGLRRVVKGNNGGYVPVIVNFGRQKNRKQRALFEFDRNLLKEIDSYEIPYWYPDYPTNFQEKKWGKLSTGNHKGFTKYSQFYPRRSLIIISAFRDRIFKLSDPSMRSFLLFVLTAASYGLTVFNRFLPERNSNVGMLANTLFIPPLYCETNAIEKIREKFKDIINVQRKLPDANGIVSTQSATDLNNIPDNSIDYAYIDPPFGDNILYVSSNSVSESWLKVFSNGNSEAIISEWRKKTPEVYKQLLFGAFRELFRVLKPGRWITVEFHNSKALIWNYLQESILRAGFVIAQVTVMDKQGTTIFMDTRSGAVDKDLVISAYKPKAEFTKKLLIEAGFDLEKEFIKQHLKMLPIAANVERTSQMLYSKFLAFYIQHGFVVSLNSEQFYRSLLSWGLEEKDGYWFVDETQANEYEKRKVTTFGKGGIQPQAVLFVSDERSARQWIWNFLDQPKTYDEIHTDFLKVLQTTEDEIPEIREILEESFVRLGNLWKRPDQLTQAELEKKRLERLLRQFEEYLSTAKANQKLKEVRLEAVIAGFTECYRSGRYKDILLVGKKLDKAILENSSDLYDFIDIAEAKVEG